ncbi:MAG: hypothetical protein LBT00_12930 [Spirochaetaceae bacterium]|nr:hypothetical protein [Spirochaetaceae bacterium]
MLRSARNDRGGVVIARHVVTSSLRGRSPKQSRRDSPAGLFRPLYRAARSQ